MKFSYTLLIIFSFIISIKAQTYKGTIILNNGNSKTGIIKSFIEDKLINLTLIDDLEHELNLDDKKLKFKETEGDEFESIAIDDIDQVTLHHESGKETIFKVIILKEVTSTGKVIQEGRKVFLPYLKKGKINIFGIRYKEISSNRISNSSMTYASVRFYYQNAKENYAINHQNIGTLDLFTIKKRYINPLIDLFKDCPEIVNDLENLFEKETVSGKNYAADDKQLKKEFKKLPREEKMKLAIIHKYNFSFIENLIHEYEDCN